MLTSTLKQTRLNVTHSQPVRQSWSLIERTIDTVMGQRVDEPM